MSSTIVTENELSFKTCSNSIVNNIIVENWLTQEIITGLYDNDNEEQLIALQAIEDMLIEIHIQRLEWYPHIDAIITSNIVPRILELLQQNQNSDIQSSCAMILNYILYGCRTTDSLDQIQSLVDAGAVPVLVSLLESDNLEAMNSAILALGYISSASLEYRDNVLSNNALKQLFRLLNDSKYIPMNAHIVWTISALLSSNRNTKDSLKCFFPTVINDLRNRVSKTLLKVKVKRVINAEVCKRLVDLLMNNDCEVVINALNILCDILNITKTWTGHCRHIQDIIDCNGLPTLRQLLSHNNQQIRYISCGVICNIISGTPQHNQLIIEENIFSDLFNIITHRMVGDTKPAILAIHNIIATGTVKQIKYLIEEGCTKYSIVVRNVEYNRHREYISHFDMH